MEEFFQKVTSQQDPFKRLGSMIPGFKGYIERQNRREADKLLRDTVARRFDEQWQRASQIQVDMVSSGMIQYVDDIERAALKLRTFIDKISTAPRGYSGLFDAVKINEKELEAIYQYDAAFFDLAEQVGRALDNVEASLGDEAALPAAIRNVTSIARMAVETYNRRSEVVIGDGKE
jgi:predicted nucleic acid-binding protein